MKFASLVFGLAVTASLVAGCKKGGSPGLVSELSALDNEACACKDQACADAVTGKVTALGQANADFDEADLPKLQAVQNHLDACLANLNPAIVAYLALTDEACACKDKACGTAVAAKATKWGADSKASKATLHGNVANVALKASQVAGTCLTKLGVPLPK